MNTEDDSMERPKVRISVRIREVSGDTLIYQTNKLEKVCHRFTTVRYVNRKKSLVRKDCQLGEYHRTKLSGPSENVFLKRELNIERRM